MSAWSDGMNEHDQLREVVVENARLRAEVERMRPVIEAAAELRLALYSLDIDVQRRAARRYDDWAVRVAIIGWRASVAALDAGEHGR